MPELPAASVEDTFYSVADVRRMDRSAIDRAGIPGYTLMCRAAQAALDLAFERFPAARTWLVVCGGGNNAGDGYALARLAAAQDVDVEVVALSKPDKLTGDARTAFDEFAAAGLTAATWTGRLPGRADLIIDAVLGSGLARPLAGDFLRAVEQLNQHNAPILALDIPTGIDGDSGERLGAAVRASLTLSFVGLKTGLVLGEGPAHCGEIAFADLDIPAECRAAAAGVLRRLPAEALGALFAPRAGDAHKGSFGRVLIVGGGPGMAGAVQIAGTAALRSGAGLVSVATHPAHAGHIAASRPELMVHAIEAAEEADALIERAAVIAIGPGLGQSDWSRRLFDAVLAAAEKADTPLVVDADALNLLPRRGAPLANAILTPHPGEAARLLNASSSLVQDDRLAALRALTERFNGSVVLKGAGTLIGAADEMPWVCTAGNPGMASPGMGDALTGIVAALRAQGFARHASAVVGVTLHAHAGDRAAAEGERGMLAMDLIEQLRACVNPRPSRYTSLQLTEQTTGNA